MHAKYQTKYEKGWYDVAQRVKAILANKDKNDVAVFSFVHFSKARYVKTAGLQVLDNM